MNLRLVDKLLAELQVLKPSLPLTVNFLLDEIERDDFRRNVREEIWGSSVEIETDYE